MGWPSACSVREWGRSRLADDVVERGRSLTEGSSGGDRHLTKSYNEKKSTALPPL
ncbi:MAG: hypothetical protein F6K30_12635 [Cyanothece sp. SIO2G6]|nr:hypothetical protein [Cyanothece sp. SIO2G6]